MKDAVHILGSSNGRQHDTENQDFQAHMAPFLVGLTPPGL
jgi:hypothetical protein